MPDPDPVEIDPRDHVLLEKIGRLRVLAWAAVLPDATERTTCWLDEFDPAGRHWCVFHAGEPVAAARLSVHGRLEEVPEAELYRGVIPTDGPGPIGSINRLVTHPGFQGCGFSDALDAVRMEAAVAAGCRTVVCSVTRGSKRLGQLTALGFVPVGEWRPEPAGTFLSGLWYQALVRELTRAGQSGVAG